MAPRSVLQQTSISLNRSDNAPVSISSSGKAAALEDDAVRAAGSATEDLRKAIIVRHPSLIAASRAGDPLWTRYIRQQQRYRDTLVQVERRIFKAEYQLHFEERDLRQESGNCAAGKEQEEEQYDEEDADDRTSSLFIPEDDQMPTDSNDFLNDALELVSPDATLELTEEDLFDNEDMIGDHSTAPQGCATSDESGTEDENNHLIRVSHGNSTIRGNLRNRIYRKGQSAFDDLLAEIQETGNEADLSRVIIRGVNVNHGIDIFPPGQEPLPLPGTWNCRFRGIDLNKVHPAWQHVAGCAQKDADLSAQQLVTRLAPLDRPRNYQFCGDGKNLYKFVPCGQTFTDEKARGEHMRSHLRTMTKGLPGAKVPTCFFGECALNPERGRIRRNGPDFVSDSELLAHVWDVHHVVIPKAITATFCEYCSKWLLEPHEWITHAVRHMHHATAIVEEVGYSGVQTGRSILPRICPFCFHDETRPVY